MWNASWGYRTHDYSAFPIEIGNKVLAVRFLNNINGNAVRILISNIYGKTPLKIREMMIAEDNGESIEDEERICWNFSSAAYLTIDGKKSIEAAPSERRFTDPAAFTLQAGRYYTVFMSFGEQPASTSGSSCFTQKVTQVFAWDSPGSIKDIPYDCFDSLSAQKLRTDLYEQEPEHFSFCGIERIEVNSVEDIHTIVCFGDSITHRSFWTAPLAQRLYHDYPGKVTLLNAGISGNRINYDASPYSPFGPWFGESAVSRFEKDLFSVARTDLVFILLGINDIFHPLYGHAPMNQMPDEYSLEKGLNQMALCASDHGTKTIGCTITPWKDCLSMFTPEADLIRKKTNEWIMRSGVFDLALDFSEMIADPADPERMMEEYDSGDHVHPSAEGGIQIAESIDVKLIWKLMEQEEK